MYPYLMEYVRDYLQVSRLNFHRNVPFWKENNIFALLIMACLCTKNQFSVDIWPFLGNIWRFTVHLDQYCVSLPHSTWKTENWKTDRNRKIIIFWLVEKEQKGRRNIYDIFHLHIGRLKHLPLLINTVWTINEVYGQDVKKTPPVMFR